MVGSGTTRNAVEGRQRNDRREAGVLSQDTVTGRVRQARAATNRWFHRNLPVRLAILAEWRQPIPVAAATIRDGRRVHRDGSVCPSWQATRSGDRHCQCQCVNWTLQLDGACLDWLQPKAATICLAAMYVCR